METKVETKIRRNGSMYQVFKVLSKDYFMNFRDFSKKDQKAISSALELGLVKMYRNGLVRLNQAGKKAFGVAND